MGAGRTGTNQDFATYMTGEMHGVLLKHSILGRLAQPAGPEPGPAFALGVTRGLGAGGLCHDLFGARTLVLIGELVPEEVSDWLSGLLIGREVRDARFWAHRKVARAQPCGWSVPTRCLLGMRR